MPPKPRCSPLEPTPIESVASGRIALRAVFYLALLALPLVLLFAEARDAQATAVDGRPKLATTATMVFDLAQVLAGDDIAVTGMMAPGVDPHLFRPTRAHVAQLLEADATLAVGLHLEAQLAPALERLESSGAHVWHAGEALDDALLAFPDGRGHAPDPHVWMDPDMWRQVVDHTAAQLIELAPGAAERIAARRDAYFSELDALARYADAALASIPREQRVLVTAHDAFEYFGRRFDVRVEGLQGLSTESEAGLARVEQLVDLVVERRIPAVFTESTVPSRGVEALMAGARARGHQVELGGHLYADATGPAGTWAGTWIGMIDHDVTTIARALGGKAPSGGFREWRTLPVAASAQPIRADRGGSL